MKNTLALPSWGLHCSRKTDVKKELPSFTGCCVAGNWGRKVSERKWPLGWVLKNLTVKRWGGPVHKEGEGHGREFQL